MRYVKSFFILLIGFLTFGYALSYMSQAVSPYLSFSKESKTVRVRQTAGVIPAAENETKQPSVFGALAQPAQVLSEQTTAPVAPAPVEELRPVSTSLPTAYELPTAPNNFLKLESSSRQTVESPVEIKYSQDNRTPLTVSTGDGETSSDHLAKFNNRNNLSENQTVLSISKHGDLTMNGNLLAEGGAHLGGRLTVEDDIEIDGIFWDSDDDFVTVDDGMRPLADNTSDLGTSDQRWQDVYFSGELYTPYATGSVIFVGTNGILEEDNAGFYWADGTNRLGVGTSSPSTRLHVLATAEQLRLGYDASNYSSFTTSSGGDLTVAPSGSDTNVTGNLSVSANTTLGDASGDSVTVNAATLALVNASTLNLVNSSTTALNIESGLLNFDTQNSRLGIGNTAPGTTLDVTGTGRFSSTLTASNGFTLTTGALNMTATSGTVRWDLSSSSSAFTVNGIFGVDTQNSRVGVGTTAPTQGLHVTDNIFTEDDLYVGAAAETLANAGFVLDGNDAFIAGMLGVEGNVYTDGSFIAGASTTISNGSITQSSGETLTIGTTAAGLTLSTTTSGTLALSSAGALNLTAGSASTWTFPSSSTALNIASGLLNLDTANSRVGIGTTAPGATLDVVGTVTASGLITATLGLTANGALTANSTFTLGDGGDTGSVNTSDWGITTAGVMSGISGISNDGAYTQSGTSANTFTGTSTFSNATYSALFTGGNVGIGTTGPGTKLHVVSSGIGANGYMLRLGKSTSGVAGSENYLQMVGDTQSWDIGIGENTHADVPNTFSIGRSGVSYDFTIDSSGRVGIGYNQAGTAKLSINGNVGIGTTGPNNALEVSSTTSPQIRAAYDGSNYATIGVASNGAVTIDATGAGAAVAVSDTLTASNGFTLTTGALNLTATSGSAALTLGSSQTAFNVNSGLFNIDTSASRVGIGTTSPGTVFSVAGLTGTASYNLVRVDTATGNFYYDSSSERYKENIEEYETDFSKILSITPKSFTDRTSGTYEVGFIAEEFSEAGLEDLVIYKDGRPDALKYDKVPIYLLGVLKNQQDVLDSLKDQMALLTSSEDTGETSESDESVATTVNSLEVSETLKVLGDVTFGGNTVLADTTVAGKLSVGFLTLNDADTSINSLAEPLKIQNNSLADVEFFNGEVTLTKSGAVLAVKVEADEVVTKLLSVEKGASRGTAVLGSGETRIEIESSVVTAESGIFLTPTTETDATLFVADVDEGEKFTVGVKNASSSDINFNWWIVN